MGCTFCEEFPQEKILTESEHFFVVLDIDPIQQGHVLIISKKHRVDYRDLRDAELVDLCHMQRHLATTFEKFFHVLGVSFILNNGKVMDEGTHFHVHVIPRYEEDEFWDHQITVWTPLSIDTLKSALR